MRWLLMGVVVWSSAALAQSDGGVPRNPDGSWVNLRCLRRVARVAGWSFNGLATKLDGQTPQQRFRAWVDPDFRVEGETLYPSQMNQNGFARSFGAFFASRVNRRPAANGHEAFYTFAVEHILTQRYPWKDLFTRRMVCTTPGSYAVVCKDDPTAPAIGVFSTTVWRDVYKGAAPDGVMLRGANNILKAMLGLTLVPSPFNMDGDATVVGRHRPGCSSCHYDSPYALDKIAALLPWKRKADAQTLVAQTPTPQTLLDGRTFSSLEELVGFIAESEDFRFWTCQLAFEYAYSRPARSCELPAFSACMQALKQSGELRDAMAALVEDPAFCAEDAP